MRVDKIAEYSVKNSSDAKSSDNNIYAMCSLSDVGLCLYNDGCCNSYYSFDYSQCSTTGVTKAGFVLSCLWDDAYKRTLAANWKE